MYLAIYKEPLAPPIDLESQESIDQKNELSVFSPI